jgi:hypothetical protein
VIVDFTFGSRPLYQRCLHADTLSLERSWEGAFPAPSCATRVNDSLLAIAAVRG